MGCNQELEESWPNLRQGPPSQKFSRTWDLNWTPGIFESPGPKPVGH